MILRLAKPGEKSFAPALNLDDGSMRDAVVDLYDWQHRGATHFACRVYELMQYADEMNLVRLSLAFPFHALAFEQWRHARTEREFFEENGFLLP
jgi:hypothetical protein